MSKISKKDIILPILSGIMLTVSFPPFGLDVMAWVSFLPLLVSVRDKPPLSSFKVGLTAGLFHYLTLIYWIVVVLSHYGNIGLVFSLAILFLLSLYLASFTALFTLILAFFNRNKLYCLWGSIIWVALEYIRANILTGFPWCLLGYSQYSRLKLIQIADITGVYGISFLIVLVNIVLYGLFIALHDRSGFHKTEILLTSFIIALTLLYGNYRLGEVNGAHISGEKIRSIRAVIVQGNIDQSLKWSSEFQEKTVGIYRTLSEQSRPFNPQIIIWPETAFPSFFQDVSNLSGEVFETAKNTKSSILFGTPAYHKEGNDIKYYNRALLISKNRLLDFYDKIHLVPFGEYVPMKKFFPFVHRLVPAAGDFSPGKKHRPLQGDDVHIGTLICFESIFPTISRIHAEHHAEMLVNITNDAWFGRTSAPYQHLCMSVFRCVENRLPMARAANTGISAFIRSDGQITNKSRLFTKETLMEEIKLHPYKTFYSQFGDIFAIMMLVIITLKCLWLIKKKRR